jgi:hypothetical protein
VLEHCALTLCPALRCGLLKQPLQSAAACVAVLRRRATLWCTCSIAAPRRRPRNRTAAVTAAVLMNRGTATLCRNTMPRHNVALRLCTGPLCRCAAPRLGAAVPRRSHLCSAVLVCGRVRPKWRPANHQCFPRVCSFVRVLLESIEELRVRFPRSRGWGGPGPGEEGTTSKMHNLFASLACHTFRSEMLHSEFVRNACLEVRLVLGSIASGSGFGWGLSQSFREKCFGKVLCEPFAAYGLAMASCFFLSLSLAVRSMSASMAESPPAFVCFIALPASHYNAKRSDADRRFWQLSPAEVPPRCLQILNCSLEPRRARPTFPSLSSAHIPFNKHIHFPTIFCLCVSSNLITRVPYSQVTARRRT